MNIINKNSKGMFYLIIFFITQFAIVISANTEVSPRGIITTPSGEKIDCTTVQTLTNAEYRTVKEQLRIDNGEFFEMFYFIENSGIKQFEKYKVAQKLSMAELYALMGYTGNGFERLNNSLWNNSSLVQSYLSSIKTLCSGMMKMPNYVGEVWRGTNILGDFEHLKKGDIYYNKAFMSTSKTPIERYRVMDIQIHIMSKNGKDIEAVSQYGFKTNKNSEKEVLFIPQSRFKIISITPSNINPKHYNIELEEIDKPIDLKLNVQSIAQSKMIINGMTHENKRLDGTSDSGSEVSDMSAVTISEANEVGEVYGQAAYHDAIKKCENEKNIVDITGKCFTECEPLPNSYQCQWISSDWFDLNPLSSKKYYDRYYNINP